jgi:hypothetical protein
MVGNTELFLVLFGGGGGDGGGAKMQGHFVNSLIGLCKCFLSGRIFALSQAGEYDFYTFKGFLWEN